MSDRQAAYEERYWERYDQHRPKPETELYDLKNLARRCVDGDASAALEWAVKATPADFLLTLAADEWDRRNPLYGCIACHDGKDLPQGYVCGECGADNPLRGY